jgi:hypothetical protein
LKTQEILGGGRNVDDQNVDRPKISERRNGLFSWSERRHHNVENVFWVDHYYDDQNVENSTFDVLIFCDAIGKFRTSKCFLTKETFDVLIFCDAIGKFRTSKWILWKTSFRCSEFTYGVENDHNVESRNFYFRRCDPFKVIWGISERRKM